MSESLKLLINCRKHTRKLVTECYNKRHTFANLDAIQFETIKAEVYDYSEILKKYNDQIQRLKWDESNDNWLAEELETCDSYFKKVRECLVMLKRTEIPAQTVEVARSMLKSPVAPLPEYKSQEGEDLLKFFRDFEDITSKFNYAEYDKFILLKQQISGRALLLLNALEADKKGYQHAKTLLTSALASKDSQIFCVIKQLANMKMTYNSDPFEYVAKMKTIMEATDKLKIDTDTFLRYFFWTGLNESFQNHMVQITNESKPTLKQINDKFFEASERYKISQSHYHKKNAARATSSKSEQPHSSSVFAVKVDYEKNKPNFRPCILCAHVNKDTTHPIFKCPNFVDAPAKRKQLDLMKGCTKCGHANHAASECQFKFKMKCKHCQGWHFGFLCTSSKKPVTKPDQGSGQPSTGSGSGVVQSVNKLSTLEALKIQFDSDMSILPTFSCVISGQSVRALKDGGSQSNFIDKSLAQNLNLKVLKPNLELKINGINTSQHYKSHLVEVPLQLGNSVKTLEAIVMPSIDIKLDLPGLSQIVEKFQSKGYVLADKFLNKSDNFISQVKFILGTKSSHIITDCDVLLGKNEDSVYSKTPHGIILKGDVRNLLNDIGNLSNNDAEMSQSHDVCKSRTPGWLGTVNSFTSMIGTTQDFNSSFEVLDEKGEVVESHLESAVNNQLKQSCQYYTNYDNQVYDENTSELNSQLVKYCLDNTVLRPEGRLEMPLLWNAKVSHLLGDNFKLAKLILKANLKKLEKDPTKLALMEETFLEQERLGIIEKIGNLEQFISEHPNYSFLPHMGVFRLNKETTKCRVVFLSNLCENNSNKIRTISHNQAIHPGPVLNQKLSSAVLHLRFDKIILCFDLCKAFSQIALREVDSNNLLFLWYKNPSKGDYTVVGYRNVRLSFGLRCSPTLLMLALYKILVLDSGDDPEHLKLLKQNIYALCYMDNCAVSAPDSDYINKAYDQLTNIFSPYGFELQQYVTNDKELQQHIDASSNSVTPSSVSLFGLQWNRFTDTLSTKPIQLSIDANTKREILSSIASQFDPFGFNGPILNRSRLFLHRLQCSKELGWDNQLPPELTKEWRNIAKQANATPENPINRFMGQRNCSFKLVACCDSSKLIFGIVVYLVDLDNNLCSFMLAKNRIINKQLESKSIPTLELQSISLATEVLIDLRNDLSGSTCLNPINITEMEVFSDSMVALSWLNSYTNKLEKMQKCSVFVQNRLHHIYKLCEQYPIIFSFVNGQQNPADAITRCISPRKLLQTNFYSGPEFIFLNDYNDILTFKIPMEEIKEISTQLAQATSVDAPELIYWSPPENYSSFKRLVRVYHCVMKFVINLQCSVRERYPNKFQDLQMIHKSPYVEAVKQLIGHDQLYYFSDIFQYIKCKDKRLATLPNLMGQLNVCQDQDGLLRVHSKCEKLTTGVDLKLPLLLHKKSTITHLIILDLHRKLNHGGCYAVLAEMRKRFYIPHYFSAVKKVLRECISCRRFKERTVKLTQSPYREWRINPPTIPFKYLFMDFLGPFTVKLSGKNYKVYLLILTCMWSRAVNLKVCRNLTVTEFLRAFQLHTFEFGLPEFCISDLGTQLVAGSNIIKNFLRDHLTNKYFDETGAKPITFEQFAKGHSELGSMVEICVKFSKRLLYGAMGKTILDYFEFEYFVAHTIHLINRRPIAFKEALRDKVGPEIPDPITPEILIHGAALPSVNVIPELQEEPDISWKPSQSLIADLKSNWSKLNKVRASLVRLYQDEFLANLVQQAVDRKDRYKPANHHLLSPGDVVLLKESYTKPHDYPMGLVKKVEKNELGQITSATILKGKTRELVRRHASVLIPLLTSSSPYPAANEDDMPKEAKSKVEEREKRKAAVVSAQKTASMLDA